MTLMYMYITANPLGSTYPKTYAVHALMYCVALSHCISELRQEFWGTSPEQPAICNDIKNN